jgi:hypothetical protein
VKHRRTCYHILKPSLSLVLRSRRTTERKRERELLRKGEKWLLSNVREGLCPPVRVLL